MTQLINSIIDLGQRALKLLNLSSKKSIFSSTQQPYFYDFEPTSKEQLQINF